MESVPVQRLSSSVINGVERRNGMLLYVNRSWSGMHGGSEVTTIDLQCDDEVKTTTIDMSRNTHDPRFEATQSY